MGEKLCSCCGRRAPLDENAYVDELRRWGPGLCVTCKTFAPILRQAIQVIKWNINQFWLEEHKDDIFAALFAPIGSEQSLVEIWQKEVARMRLALANQAEEKKP